MTALEELRIKTRGRALAGEAWACCGRSLKALASSAHTPARGDFDQLERELGRPLTPRESALFVHAFRTELHSLNVEQELRALGFTPEELQQRSVSR